jgi:hypothetical protein
MVKRLTLPAILSLLLLSLALTALADGPPGVVVTTNEPGQVAPGFVFVDAFRQPLTGTIPYAYILDSEGNPVHVETFVIFDRATD